VVGTVWDERFEHILRSHLSLAAPTEALDPDADLGRLGLDSLTSVQLLTALEEAYDVSVPDELLDNEMFETPISMWTVIDSLR
jgi:acyl carrier protein